MTQVLHRFVLIISLVALTGSHWGVLQGIAWVSMIGDRVETRSFADSVASTFSGDEPCGLCDAIERGKGEERDSSTVKTESKHPLAAASATGFISVHPPVIAVLPEDEFVAAALPDPPAPPPPDLA